MNRHFVFVEAPIDVVAPDALAWGEGAWWPNKCGATFVCLTDGPMQVGTKYRLKVKKLFVPDAIVEVTKLVPNRMVERTFQTGIFHGHEQVKVEERANGTRVDYELQYTLQGLPGKLLWPMYRKAHDKNIKLILDALKEHVLQKYRQQQNKEGEGT